MPDVVKVTFGLDYNILKFHKELEEKLRYEQEHVDIGDKAKLLTEYDLQLKQQLVRIERQRIEGLRDDLIQSMDVVRSGQRLQDYLTASSDIVDEYRKMGRHVERVSVGQTDDYRITEQDSKRLNVIERYFLVASRFVNVDIVRTLKLQDSCDECGQSMKDVYVREDKIQKCPHCGFERKAGFSAVYQSTTTGGSGREYDNLGNFLKEYNAFQGKQKILVDRDVYGLLDRYFTGRGMQTGEWIKANVPLDEWGKREGTSLQALNDALKAIGHPELYKHGNYIGREYWGWKLHELDHLKEAIIQDYEATQTVYNSLDYSERERKSNIPTQFRLLQHLLLRGVKVRPADFKLMTEDCNAKYIQLWQKMCQGAGKPHIKYIEIAYP